MAGRPKFRNQRFQMIANKSSTSSVPSTAGYPESPFKREFVRDPYGNGGGTWVTKEYHPGGVVDDWADLEKH
jgi:hypothetical protein